MREKYSYLFLLGVLIIATFLRLNQLSIAPPGLYPDEAMNGNNALEALRTHDFKVYYPDNNGREGLFINIQALSLKFFGINEPWVLRFPSAIFGILTVLGVYFLGKELFSKRVGLLASFFIATSVWHIIFSRIGFRAIMAPLLLTWALFLFHYALRNSSTRKYILPAILGGIVFGLGFYTYIAYRIMPLLFLLFIPFYLRDKKFWQVAGVFVATTFLVGLPIGIYYLQHPADFLGRTSQVSVFSSPHAFKDLSENTLKTFGMFNFIGDFNPRHNIPGRPEIFWPVGVLLIWGIILGIQNLRHKNLNALVNPAEQSLEFHSPESERNLRLSFALLFGWFFLAMLPVVISSEGLPHALRAILMIPPLFVLAAIGGIACYHYFRKHFQKTSVLQITSALFLIFLFYEAYQSYFVLFAKGKDTPAAFSSDFVDLGHRLNQLPKSMPKYVIVQGQGVLVRGLPMPTQTTMFITDTWGEEQRKEKNIYYILPNEINRIPNGSKVFFIR